MIKSNFKKCHLYTDQKLDKTIGRNW